MEEVGSPKPSRETPWNIPEVLPFSPHLPPPWNVSAVRAKMLDSGPGTKLKHRSERMDEPGILLVVSFTLTGPQGPPGVYSRISPAH